MPKNTDSKIGGRAPARAHVASSRSLPAEDERIDLVTASITYDEARVLARRLLTVDMSSDMFATILLLIAAATYEARFSENIYYAALHELMPNVTLAANATEQAQITELRKLRQAESEVR